MSLIVALDRIVEYIALCLSFDAKKIAEANCRVEERLDERWIE